MLSFCFYYSILFAATFWAYMAEHSGCSKRKEYIYRFLLFFSLWLPAIFREGIGTDYVSYVSLFKYADIGDIEPGFYYICQAVKFMGLDYHWMFAIVALITYCPICFGVPRKGLSLTVMFFCFLFYLNTWSLIRQGAAVCLICWAVFQLLEGKRLKFITIVLLASTMHYSALLLLPFYFLWNKPLNRLFAIVIIAIGIASILLFGAIDYLFSSAIFVDSHYGRYVTSGFNRETEIGTGLGVIIRLIIPIYAVYLLPKSKNYFHGYEFVIYLNIAYILSYCLALQIHIFNRIVDLFTFAPFMTMGIIVAYMHHKFKKIILFVIIALNLMLFYKSIIAGNSNNIGGLGIYPYQTFLS